MPKARISTTTATWDHARIVIQNYYDENSFSRMMIASFCMVLFIGCGFWCICASCQLNKSQENSYHKNSEFEKDDEQPKRPNAGLEGVKVYV
ncbi:unnamed protein product [Caenorhabditis brenneri]